MTNLIRVSGIALIISACSIVTSPLIEQHQQVEGKSLARYADMWWQWSYSMPAHQSPVRDLTGDACHINQRGKVWYLAGGYDKARIQRKCQIPEGKHVFFPIINRVYWPDKGTQPSCDEVKKHAMLPHTERLELWVKINEQRLPDIKHYRFSSAECFNLTQEVPAEYRAPDIYPAASDGYWVMLAPLPVGKHTLTFHAEYKHGANPARLAQHIEYEIHVVPGS